MGKTERNVGLAARGSAWSLRLLLATALAVLTIVPGFANAESSKTILNEADAAQVAAFPTIATGEVSDAQTGLPISGAYVDAIWFSPNQVDWDFAGETETGADGMYALEDSIQRAPGWYSVYAEADGYEGYDVWMEWDGETTLIVDFELELFIGPSSIDIQHDAAGVTFDRFVTGYNSAYSGGGYVYGRWTGTKLQARFTGDVIRWIGPKQPSYGKADVYIDGVKAATVDCYATDAEKTTSAVLWESDLLTDGAHTLEIRLVGQKNAASSGYAVVLDRFEVEGAAPAGGGTRHDEKTGTLSGPWIYGANAAYIAKGYNYSRYTNAAFTKTFNGTRVAWLGPKTSGYGRAKVYIDGVLQGTVSQYGMTGWRYKVWESKSLPPGNHTLKIVPTGTKDAASKSTIIVIDALDVTP